MGYLKWRFGGGKVIGNAKEITGSRDGHGNVWLM